MTVKPHLQKLQAIHQQIGDYKQQVAKNVEVIQEENFQKMVQIKDACQHLDRVLQMETRKRKANILSLQDNIKQLIQTTGQQINEGCDKIQENIKNNDTEITNSFDNMIQQIEKTETALIKIVDEWKSASTQSTLMLKNILDESRAQRIKKHSELVLLVNKRWSEFQLANDLNVNEAERGIINAVTLIQTKNKSYESGNLNCQQQFDGEIQQLNKLQSDEVAVRKQKLNEVVQVLSQCIEMIQTNMGKMGQFVERQ